MSCCFFVFFTGKWVTGLISFNTLDDVKGSFKRKKWLVVSELVHELCSGRLLIADSEPWDLVALPISLALQIYGNIESRTAFSSRGIFPLLEKYLRVCRSGSLPPPILPFKIPSCIHIIFLFWWVLTQRLATYFKNILNRPEMPLSTIAMLL